MTWEEFDDGTAPIAPDGKELELRIELGRARCALTKRTNCAAVRWFHWTP